MNGKKVIEQLENDLGNGKQIYNYLVGGLVKNYGISFDVAEDAVQDYYLSMIRGKKRISFNGVVEDSLQFRCFLFTGAKRKMIDILKKKANQEIGMEDGFEILEKKQKANSRLDWISMNRQKIEWLQYFEKVAKGWTLDEIARKEDCPVGTIKSRMHRDRILIRREYERS